MNYRRMPIRTLMLAVAAVALTISGIEAGRALYRNWEACRVGARGLEDDADVAARGAILWTMRYASMSILGFYEEGQAEAERRYCHQLCREWARAAWRAQHLRERMWQPWERPLESRTMISRRQRG